MAHVTVIVTWNVQACRGVDGIVDPGRIARVIKSMAPADVICLQEIACNDPERQGDAPADQVEALADLFPEFEVHFGAAIDRAGEPDGTRWRFGNLILTRPRAIQAFFYSLPEPADGDNKHMPRQATEILIAEAGHVLRVVTTYFDYHLPINRVAQIDRLREIQAQVLANHRTPPPDPGRGPFAATSRPASLVLYGDFNFFAGGGHYYRLLSPGENDAPPFRDAWSVCRGDIPNDPTSGVFDREQWPNGPHCRDFFCVTADVAGSIRSIDVDLDTNASDQQPVRLDLNW
jgi:endonuclease/exonuclease/phosphatase family metal-dependent hydrolase